MTDLVVIVPSRGRPSAAAELAAAFRDTCTADTRLVIAVDEDDPTLEQYDEELPRPLGLVVGLAVADAPSSMVKTLNTCAESQLRLDQQPFALGFMGDDHRPRTQGWDRLYVEALRELGTGIVYGDDLLQGERIPTQVAMTADIVRALGFMAPPTLVHLAVDNWWKELGLGAGCISYLPGVVVEHMHPIAGKAEWDAGHIRVNQQSMYDRDLAEFARLRRDELPTAVEKVKALR